MRYIEVNSVKEEINWLISSIEEFNTQHEFKELSSKDIDLYRFLAKQIVFFKKMLVAYPKTYFIKVLISDFYSLTVNDLKNESRYFYLNQRSIIENYIRMIEVNEENASHITKKSFEDLKLNNEISDSEFGKIMNEYKISCSYIHGGIELENHLVTNFIESTIYVSSISKRKRESQLAQFIDLINILNDLFLINNFDEVDSAFHRSKILLKYLMGENYVRKLRVCE